MSSVYMASPFTKLCLAQYVIRIPFEPISPILLERDSSTISHYSTAKCLVDIAYAEARQTGER